MSGLEQTFYIMAIVYMSVMFVLILALVIAVFVIRAKVVDIQRRIEYKIDEVTNVAAKGGELVGKVTGRAARAAAGKLKKLPKS